MEKGNTALILNPFIDGMREAGVEVELFYTRKLNVNPCTGEFDCWLKTPGKCYLDDDMQMLQPKLREADIWVFATPVYWGGISGPMKDLIDRMVPLSQPYMELRDGHCRMALSGDTKPGKVVLVSNCAFWEMDNFDLLLGHMKEFCENLGRQFAGALLRPHGPALMPMKEQGAPVSDVFEAAKEAGRQLAEDGKMSYETLKIVGRELIPLEMYIQTLNQIHQQALGALMKK
jgi:multimeric flavodoxin WrbA